MVFLHYGNWEQEMYGAFDISSSSLGEKCGFLSFLQMWREDLKALILWCWCQNHSLPIALRLPFHSHAALGCVSLSETLAQHQWQRTPHHKSFWWSKMRRKHLVWIILILLLTHCTHTTHRIPVCWIKMRGQVRTILHCSYHYTRKTVSQLPWSGFSEIPFWSANVVVCCTL